MSKLVGLPANLSRRSAKYLLRERPDTAMFPKDVEFHRFEVEKVSDTFECIKKVLAALSNNSCGTFFVRFILSFKMMQVDHIALFARELQ